MAGVMEEILYKETLEFAKKMIERGKMTLNEIAEDLNLPLEKVRELATNISAETKGQI